MMQLSDRMDGASTPAAQQSAISDTIAFIEQNGGNKMAIYPYLAQKGFDASVLQGAGLDPAAIDQVAQNIAQKTPATQADLNNLSDAHREQVEQLQAVIDDLRAQLEAMVAEQQRLNTQVEAQQDAMTSGPSTRPTEGLAPAEGEAAPEGTMTAAQLSSLANVPIRG
jgi:septal ring factor EnvC (AmiA/AmiB activator)